MSQAIKIGDRWVGERHPIYIVAEIGINHNGDVEIAKRLIDAARSAGCDAVKFQKRTPEFCVPSEEKNRMCQTPWGYITYLAYRKKIELGFEEYKEIDRYCKEKGLTWFTSCWDEPSIDFIKQFNPPVCKIPSPVVTDISLLKCFKQIARPLILSTGMSTMEQIKNAVEILGMDNLILVHCTSTYPCPPEELNLLTIKTLEKKFSCPIGYSGHEAGLPTTVAAVALGICYVERHITLDRAMWGTDQAASVEPGGFSRLVKYIRVVEHAMGDGQKCVYKSEIPAMRKLRRTGI